MIVFHLSMADDSSSPKELSLLPKKKTNNQKYSYIIGLYEERLAKYILNYNIT